MKKPSKRKRQPVFSRASLKWLQAAGEWRLLSLLFQNPTRESRRELSRLAREDSGKLGPLAREWAEIPLKEAAAEFQRIFGPGGVPAVESSYDPNALAGRGPLMADIAGFHEAFAYRPATPPAEVPDHIAVELDFLSYLAFKAAFALHAKQKKQCHIAATAHARFLQDHLRTWLDAFRKRLDGSVSPFYARAAMAVEEAAMVPAPRTT